MKVFTAVTLATLLGYSQAGCPNSCSGHGTCGVDEVVSLFSSLISKKSRLLSLLRLLQCTCYHGWGSNGMAGGDCSERFCPFELAWVDSPQKDGTRHRYAECANKGTCNRETGECKCFDGYEGKACARQSCPNHCSGHGTCEFMKDLEFGVVFNEYYDGSTNALSGVGAGGKKFTDSHITWDLDRARACVCDPGWTGLDCTERMCPYGNDVMDVIPGFDENANSGLLNYGNEVGQTQTITLYDADLDNSNFDGQTFAMQFTSKHNETFATQPIAWNTDEDILATSIATALKKLPNKVINDIDVDVDASTGAAGVIIEVTFTGTSVQGKQHKLEVLVEPCPEGCTPSITGLTNIRTFSATTLSTVEITTPGSHQSHECGRRGTCDRITGTCKCYEGFTGDTCGVLSALAQSGRD